VLLGLVPPTDLQLTATIDPPVAGHPQGHFSETNEGNNSQTEVTTVSGTSCANCVDLVAAQLVAVPGFTDGSNTDQTFVAQVVNVGDVSTALNPVTDPLVRLAVIANTGSFTSVDAPVLSNPAFAPLCTTATAPLIGPFTVVTVTCNGNLAPAEGLTIALTIHGVSGDLLSFVFADPNDVITNSTTPPEFREDNNLILTSVVHF